MARFTMCPACQAEYDDPGDRRFHAQPNACPACGPRVWLEDVRSARRSRDSTDPLEAAAGLLAVGRILAIKGLGGFHLAVRADDERAVARLRRRKNREAKPLAVMVGGPGGGAADLAIIDAAEAELLTSPRAPIVLVEKNDGDHGDRLRRSRPATGGWGSCCPTPRCTTCCSTSCGSAASTPWS